MVEGAASVDSEGKAELHPKSRTLARTSKVQFLLDLFEDCALEYDRQLLRNSVFHRLAAGGLSRVGDCGGLAACKKVSGICVGDPRGDASGGDAGSPDIWI